MTHPFHPWRGREFQILTVRRNWGEDRVMFTGPGGRMLSMPLNWTSIATEDPFLRIARGRSLFRPSDLVALLHLVQALKEGDRGSM